MGRQPCCDKVGLKKGPWTAEEDKKLINFILTNGQCCWRAVPKLAGLLRCGKSCRLRWTNYLRPDLKRGLLSDHEEQLVIDLHAQLGNRWSKIASHMPGRTDNEIKNHWNTHIKKKLKKMGIDPLTHKPLSPSSTPSPPQSDQIDQTQKPKSKSSAKFVENNDQNINNNKDQETSSSPQSTITTNTCDKEETENMNNTDMEKIISALENDDGNNNQESSFQLMSGFCTDEVPLIEPHEILVTNPTPSSSTTTTASSSSSSSSSNMLLEDYLQIPDFDWPYEHNNFLWDDDFVGSWDVAINDQRHLEQDVDKKQINNLDYNLVLDQESSWAFGLL